jgi:dCTP deaminase
VILTDREIQIALEHGLIRIEPAPDESAYSSTSVDLTLDENLSQFRKRPSGVETAIDPGAPNFNHEQALQDLLEPRIKIPPRNGHLFEPGRLLLAWTREYIKLEPHARIAARVEGKSSLARLGIGVHITAPTIHAGFEGQIRLEMYNHGMMPVRLRAGMRICQLILEQTLGVPVQGYKGRFSRQSSTRKKG